MSGEGFMARRRGFTLVEILISTFLVVMGVTAWGTAFGVASLTLSQSRHCDTAANACYAELEAWRGRGYSQIPSATTTVTLTGDSLIRALPAGLPNAIGQLVIRRISVTGSEGSYSYQQTTADTGRVQLEMTVQWTGTGIDHGAVTVGTMVLQ